MRKTAFTLIELLVVIAIIAILAAILFPVFAQAKLAAKKTQALSNVKQLGTAVMLYNGDTDDNYPFAFGSTSWTGKDLWVQNVQPYVKSIAMFASPADSMGGQAPTIGTWAGVGVSFAANSYYGGWDGTGFQLRGPMGVANNGTWLDGSQQSATAMTVPAGTVLFTEKHGDDIAAWNLARNGNSFNDRGNFSAFGMGGVLGGGHIDGIGWGPQNIPDGTRNPAVPGFETGPQGAVSSKYSNQSVFVFLDGHAKAMVPAATNPDPVNRPQDNLWDGKR